MLSNLITFIYHTGNIEIWVLNRNYRFLFRYFLFFFFFFSHLHLVKIIFIEEISRKYLRLALCWNSEGMMKSSLMEENGRRRRTKINSITTISIQFRAQSNLVFCWQNYCIVSFIPRWLPQRLNKNACLLVVSLYSRGCCCTHSFCQFARWMRIERLQ